LTRLARSKTSHCWSIQKETHRFSEYRKKLRAFRIALDMAFSRPIKIHNRQKCRTNGIIISLSRVHGTVNQWIKIIVNYRRTSVPFGIHHNAIRYGIHLDSLVENPSHWFRGIQIRYPIVEISSCTQPLVSVRRDKNMFLTIKSHYRWAFYGNWTTRPP
jgi:hypothetical protein